MFMTSWMMCISGCRQSSVSAADGRKHCLLMDEVDGMAGNEDRGGVQVPNSIVFFVLFFSVCICQPNSNLVYFYCATLC